MYGNSRGRQMEGATILAVGGAGFVGSNLVRRCLSEGCERVVVIDNFLSSSRDNLPEDGRVEIREGSAADDALLAKLERFDYVFHLATYHGNESSIANPLVDHDNNLLPTLKLYERLRVSGAKRVVYPSTGCALAPRGEGPADPVVEDGPVPIDYDSPYQISKIAGEMYGVYYHQRHGLPVVRARFQNVYGPGEVLGSGRWRGTPATIWRNVTPAFVYRALKGLPLPVHGSGSGTRDFIYVADIVEGLLRCALAEGVEGDVFNLASGVETPIRVLAETINELTGNQAGVQETPQRGWDRSVHRVGSTLKSRDILGFAAQTTLRDGLRETIAWTRAHLGRIESSIQQHRAYCPVDL